MRDREGQQPEHHQCTLQFFVGVLESSLLVAIDGSADSAALVKLSLSADLPRSARCRCLLHSLPANWTGPEQNNLTAKAMTLSLGCFIRIPRRLAGARTKQFNYECEHVEVTSFCRIPGELAANARAPRPFVQPVSVESRPGTPPRRPAPRRSNASPATRAYLPGGPNASYALVARCGAVMPWHGVSLGVASRVAHLALASSSVSTRPCGAKQARVQQDSVGTDPRNSTRPPTDLRASVRGAVRKCSDAAPECACTPRPIEPLRLSDCHTLCSQGDVLLLLLVVMATRRHLRVQNSPRACEGHK